MIFISQAQIYQFSQSQKSIGLLVQFEIYNPSVLNVHLDPNSFHLIATIGNPKTGVQYELKDAPITNLTCETVINSGTTIVEVKQMLHVGDQLYATLLE